MNNIFTKSNLKYFLLAAFCIALIDQATKIWALNFLQYESNVPLNTYFSFHRTYNESTFLLNIDIQQTNWNISVLQYRILFILVGLVLLSGIFWVSTREAMNQGCWTSEFAKTGLFMIAGGFLGNGFDRAFREEGVVDFIKFALYENNQIQIGIIFNIADVMIYFGELCLIISWFLIVFNVVKNKFFNSNRQIIPQSA